MMTLLLLLRSVIGLIFLIGLIFASGYISFYWNFDSKSDKPIGVYKIIFKYGICYPVQVFKLANSTYNVIGSVILTTLSLIVYPSFAFVSILLLIVISVLFGFDLIFRKKDKEN